MATTYTQIRDSAYGKSSKNQLGVLTTPIEDLREIHELVQGAFAFAAALNPTRLAASLGVVGSGGSWGRPDAAEAIIAIRTATGADISVVPFDDPLADDPNPAVYEFGGNFTLSPNQANPPGPNDTLTFHFSKRPDEPVDLTSDIDSLYPDAYTELISVGYSAYLSRKDGRDAETVAFSADRNQWAKNFASWLQRGTPILRKRFGQRDIHNVETLIPLLGGV